MQTLKIFYDVRSVNFPYQIEQFPSPQKRLFCKEDQCH